MTFDSDIMQIATSLRALIFASTPPQDGERAPGVPAAAEGGQGGWDLVYSKFWRPAHESRVTLH